MAARTMPRQSPRTMRTGRRAAAAISPSTGTGTTSRPVISSCSCRTKAMITILNRSIVWVLAVSWSVDAWSSSTHVVTRSMKQKATQRLLLLQSKPPSRRSIFPQNIILRMYNDQNNMQERSYGRDGGGSYPYYQEDRSQDQRGYDEYAEDAYDSYYDNRDRQNDDYNRRDGYGSQYRSRDYNQGQNSYDDRYGRYDETYPERYGRDADNRNGYYERESPFDADRRRGDLTYRPREELRRQNGNDGRYNSDYMYSDSERHKSNLARRRRYRYDDDGDDPFLSFPRMPLLGLSSMFSSMLDPFASVDAIMERMMTPMMNRASRMQREINDMMRDDAGDLIDQALTILQDDDAVQNMLRRANHDSDGPPTRLTGDDGWPPPVFSRSSSMAIVNGMQRQVVKLGVRLNYPWNLWLVAENGVLQRLVLVDDDNGEEMDIPVNNRYASRDGNNNSNEDGVIDAEVLYD